MRRILWTPAVLALACATVVSAQTTIASVVDTFSGSASLAPGSLATISGTGLGSNPNITVGGKTAYTVTPAAAYAGTRTLIQIPVDAPTGSTSLAVTLSSGATASYPLTLAAYAPAVLASPIAGIVAPQHQASGIPVNAAAPAHSGETILLAASGLGATSPTVPTGTTPASVAGATTLPTVTLNGSAVTGVTAGLSTQLPGVYQILFTVPGSLSTGNYPLVVTIGGVSSASIPLPVGTAPTAPTIAFIADAASSGTAFCAGGAATLFGLNFGTNPTISVGGKAAYLITTQSANQLIIEIPVDVPTGSQSVIVTPAGGPASAAYPITISAYAPALINAATGLVISPVHAKSGAPVTGANPATAGESIVVSAVGLGPTTPSVATGAAAPSGNATAAAPTVKLNGSAVSGAVTAGLVAGGAGVYQVTFTVPASQPTGNPFLSINIGGVESNYIHLPVTGSSTNPAIKSLQNNYSNIVPGLPNYGIAQGSIFDIFGANLANSSTGLQSTPLSTTLAGVSVSVTVNGTTTQPILYYVTPGQLGAILPSATPVGDGTVTVNNNGALSATAPIHVVESAFGILTMNGAGTGPAAAFNATSQYLGYTNALNPGDYFILWGTGVGPSAGDETVAQTPTDLSSVPFSIEVGGIQAQVYYHGRSQYPGLDQVIGIVPANVKPGCWVSVATRSGNIVSNYATLPVATTGRTCSEPSLGISAAQMATLMGQSSFNIGSLEFDKAAVPGNGGALNVTDTVKGQFIRISPATFSSTLLGPSPGSCVAIGSSNSNPYNGTIAGTALFAGPTLNVSSTGGSTQVSAKTPGVYNTDVGGAGTSQPVLLSNSGGTVTIDNGAGGSDVGSFTVSNTLASPVLSWAQASTLASISRLSGATVSWTNGDANGVLQIVGTSIGTGVSTQFACTVAASAGQFALPASLLLTLPASDPSGASTLELNEQLLPKAYTATGLDFGLLHLNLSISIPVTYQ